jgi:hypothetical protein
MRDYPSFSPLLKPPRGARSDTRLEPQLDRSSRVTAAAQPQRSAHAPQRPRLVRSTPLPQLRHLGCGAQIPIDPRLRRSFPQRGFLPWRLWDAGKGTRGWSHTAGIQNPLTTADFRAFPESDKSPCVSLHAPAPVLQADSNIPSASSLSVRISSMVSRPSLGVPETSGVDRAPAPAGSGR